MSSDCSEIVIPARIKESFIVNNPRFTFLYGHDVANKGALGQCVVCVGHENCFPIPTCWKMCKSSGYFQDSQYDEIKHLVDDAILKATLYTPVRPLIVIPFPKIGCGASRMKEFAPKAFAYMSQQIASITYKNIRWSYV